MRAAFSAPDDLFFRQRQPRLEQARQCFDLGRAEPTKHIEARDEVFGSQAEIEPDAFARALSVDCVFAFERAIELAADDAVLRQLPDQRHLQRQAGLGEEMPLRFLARMFGILQPQGVDGARSRLKPRRQNLLQVARDRLAHQRRQPLSVLSHKLLEREFPHQERFEPNRYRLLKQTLDPLAADEENARTGSRMYRRGGSRRRAHSRPRRPFSRRR